MKFLEMFLSGGIIMWIILICLIVALIIVFQKLGEIRKSQVSVGAFSIKIRSYLKKKDIAGAMAYCMEENSLISNIIRKGLKRYKLGRRRVVEAVESAARIEIKKLEKGLPVLATIAAGAPMLGFLGTVIGLMTTFIQLQNNADNIITTNLSTGIWQPLITSAFGLIVGIPVMAAYNYFISLISKNVHEMEVMATDIIDVLDNNDSDFADDEENEDE